MPYTDSGSEVDSLSTEDIKLFKNFLRTFEFIAARESACPDKITKGQSTTPTLNANSNGSTEGQSTTVASGRNADRDAAQINPDRLAAFNGYLKTSNDLKREMSELLLQMQRVGGHETASIGSQLNKTRYLVSKLDAAFGDASYKSEQKDLEESIEDTMIFLRDIQLKCLDLLKTLYRQNHAFRFLQRLVGDLDKAQYDIASQPDMEAKLSMIFKTVVPQLKRSFYRLKKDFRSFSNKTLPEFVNEEEERATTRYLTLTTIATFFSSITATTLQFSFEGDTKALSGVVNLFWYLSLVFSVSSGINSLLSMLWRKSAVYSEERRPPNCIKLWLTVAPVYFLAISAFAFVIGLSLFVYSSNQPTYVATTTIGFTALHVLCLLIVISWLIVRRNWATLFVQSLRRNFSWILLLDNEAFDANRLIGANGNWPTHVSHPSAAVQLLRLFVTFLRAGFNILKGCLLVVILKISLLIASLQDAIKHLKSSKGTQSQPSQSGDIEKGNPALKPVTAREPGPRTGLEHDIEGFIEALGGTFTGSNSIAVADFRKRVSDWANGSYPADTIEIALRSLLWGYPDLLQQFRQKVLPTMKAEESPFGDSTVVFRPRLHVSNTVGNQSSVNHSTSGPTTTINAGGPEGDEVHEQSPSRTKQLVTPERTRKAAGPSDVGLSDQIVASGSAAGDGSDDTARVSSSLVGEVEEKGSDDERREEGSEKKSHKEAEGLSRREVC